MDFQSWLDAVNGNVIGDGQCVALVEDYATRVCGTGQISTDPTGFAGSMYANGPSAGYGQQPSSAAGMPGYIAVWGVGPFTPLTHTAVVVQDNGGTLKCMTQNPGPAHYMDIPKIGLEGYLTMGGSPTANTAGDIHSKIGANPFAGFAAFDQLNKAVNWIGNKDNWKRIGVFLLGASLLLIALLLFLDNSGGLQWTGKTIRNMKQSIPAKSGMAA